MARTLKDIERRRTLAQVRELRGLDRAAHFAAGGTLEAWRGRHLVEIDKLREERRMTCRRRRIDDEG